MQKTLSVTLLLALSACDGGGSSAPGVVTKGSTALRLPDTETQGGEADALAASLLLSAGLPLVLPGRPEFRMPDRTLANELVHRSLTHLSVSGFGGGAGAGVSGVGSERIRRLAKDASAPPDRNANGTNLDEVWERELASLSEAAGARAPRIEFPLLFAWSRGRADLAASVVGKSEGEYGAWQTVPTGDDLVASAHVGHGIRARVLAALSLLATNRGDQLGPDAESGRLGALLLQQAVAIEETLVASLFFDGTTLGRLNDPANYDPKVARRWVPASFRIALADVPKGTPAGYVPAERGSSLAALASLLEAEAQLAWIGSDRNPNPTLRDLLRGRPFGEANSPRKPRQAQPMAITSGRAEVTYETDIKPLIALYYCSSCHTGGATLGKFDTRSYEAILRGGEHQATNPAVVPGNAQASLLYQTLLAAVPGVSARMPQGGPYLSPGELSLVADWIDGGAKKEPSTPVPPPRIGQDLARALVKNLAAMHFDSTSGALYDRHDGDAPVLWAGSAATGAALSALTLWLEVVPTDVEARNVLTAAAKFARERLSDVDGKVFAGIDLATLAATGPGSLEDTARLCAGLFAAARALGDTESLVRARRIGGELLAPAWWNETDQLLRTEPTRTGRRYTGPALDAALAALRELAADGIVANAAAVHDKLLAKLRPVLAYSEWSGRGEIAGDGNPDTDGNGIPEPALAGGTFGRAPLLASEILEGPAPAEEPLSEPITWSRHVRPLFQATCVGCHVDGAARGNYRLDTPKQANTPGDSGGRWPLIVPGKPEDSLLYRMLVDRTPVYGHQMPLQKPPLDDRGKDLVRLWIQQGATGR